MSSKLLIIENDPELRQLLIKNLKWEGHSCEWAATLQEAWRKTVQHEYDCVLTELDLPDGDGLLLVDLLHRENSSTGIIILSIRNTLEDRIQGLNRGADDYLVKPFHLSELQARLKALLRRKAGGGRQLHFNELIIDLEARSVVAAGRPLTLTKKEFNILAYLARNKNRVVTKDSLAGHLWGDYMDNAVSFDFIYAHVKNLRKKLIAAGCGQYLQTVYGIGYRFTV